MTLHTLPDYKFKDKSQGKAMWHKISELVESREFTQFEVVSACLDGKISVCNPEGMELIRVNIPVEGDKKNKSLITAQFLMDIDTKMDIPEILYNSYEDLKDCLISDSDRLAISLSYFAKEKEAKTFTSEYFINLAKEKLAASNKQVVKPDDSIAPEDTKTISAKSLGHFYRLILVIAEIGNVNLAERGIQNNIVITSQTMNLPLSKGYISEKLNAILAYKEAANKSS